MKFLLIVNFFNNCLQYNITQLSFDRALLTKFTVEARQSLGFSVSKV